MKNSQTRIRILATAIVMGFSLTGYAGDSAGTAQTTNPEGGWACRICEHDVKGGDTLQAQLAPGVGHCLWLRPRAQAAP